MAWNIHYVNLALMWQGMENQKHQNRKEETYNGSQKVKPMMMKELWPFSTQPTFDNMKCRVSLLDASLSGWGLLLLQ